MTLLEQLNKDMIEAMKNHEKEKLAVIRGVKAELKKKQSPLPSAKDFFCIFAYHSIVYQQLLL